MQNCIVNIRPHSKQIDEVEVKITQDLEIRWKGPYDWFVVGNKHLDPDNLVAFKAFLKEVVVPKLLKLAAEYGVEIRGQEIIFHFPGTG